MRREVIGVPECPLLHRWTLLDVGAAKLLVHHFLPEQRDRAPHDHPRSFVTVVLRGGYDDVTPTGVVDRLRAPCVRYRNAEHAHITRAHPDGAWTLVAMGRLVRPWGFLHAGRWWAWREFERRFGHGFRCEQPPVA